MGFYECTCMVSGVSLLGDDATCVILRRDAEMGFTPVTLPVSGAYNRMGAVDRITENANTELIVAFFSEQIRTGRFFAEYQTTINETVWPAPSPEYASVIDGLVGLIERNTTVWHCLNMGSEPWVTFDGDALVLSLIAQPIWDAITKSAATGSESLESLFTTVFDGDPIAEGIYGGQLPGVAAQVRELTAVDAFMRRRALRWKPPSEYDQHWKDIVLGYLERARRDFVDVPEVMAGLDACAEQTAILLEERDEG
jgi:hypothetical protein